MPWNEAAGESGGQVRQAEGAAGPRFIRWERKFSPPEVEAGAGWWAGDVLGVSWPLREVRRLRPGPSALPPSRCLLVRGRFTDPGVSSAWITLDDVLIMLPMLLCSALREWK